MSILEESEMASREARQFSARGARFVRFSVDVVVWDELWICAIRVPQSEDLSVWGHDDDEVTWLGAGCRCRRRQAELAQLQKEFGEEIRVGVGFEICQTSVSAGLVV